MEMIGGVYTGEQSTEVEKMSRVRETEEKTLTEQRALMMRYFSLRKSDLRRLGTLTLFQVELALSMVGNYLPLRVTVEP